MPAPRQLTVVVSLDVADHHLDGEHHPYLLRLAPAQPWTTVVGSGLDYAR